MHYRLAMEIFLQTFVGSSLSPAKAVIEDVDPAPTTPMARRTNIERAAGFLLQDGAFLHQDAVRGGSTLTLRSHSQASHMRFSTTWGMEPGDETRNSGKKVEFPECVTRKFDRKSGISGSIG